MNKLFNFNVFKSVQISSLSDSPQMNSIKSRTKLMSLKRYFPSPRNSKCVPTNGNNIFVASSLPTQLDQRNFPPRMPGDDTVNGIKFAPLPKPHDARETDRTVVLRLIFILHYFYSTQDTRSGSLMPPLTGWLAAAAFGFVCMRERNLESGERVFNIKFL